MSFFEETVMSDEHHYELTSKWIRDKIVSISPKDKSEFEVVLLLTFGQSPHLVRSRLRTSFWHLLCLVMVCHLQVLRSDSTRISLASRLRHQGTSNKGSLVGSSRRSQYQYGSLCLPRKIRKR